MPVGAHEGYRRNLTELHCGNRGVQYIEEKSMARFPNLEVLWANGNRIAKLSGLQHNWRLKHLYLQDNCIVTLTNNSCCLGELRSLETLELGNNQLQDLKATLGVISKIRALRKLSLYGNPCANEKVFCVKTGISDTEVCDP